MKKIAILFFIPSLFGCEEHDERKDDYKIVQIGVIKDADVVPTSDNESMKTQIKTDSFFLVVNAIPTLNMGAVLNAKVEGNRIIEVQDSKKEWYSVR